jgi:hypothetical protein
MPTIKITDDRQGATFRTGINGRLFDLPINQELNVSDAMVEHLRGTGVRFDKVDAKRASSSKEGSVEGLARPIGPHDVEFPGTAAKGADAGPRPSGAEAGDQPGDVTTAGAEVQHTDGERPHGDMIEEDAKVSDIRVAAERTAAKDAPVAEKAGEGEGGTDKASPQDVTPSHKDTGKGGRAPEAGKSGREPEKGKGGRTPGSADGRGKSAH